MGNMKEIHGISGSLKETPVPHRREQEEEPAKKSCRGDGRN